jgi:hypothetical protein
MCGVDHPLSGVFMKKRSIAILSLFALVLASVPAPRLQAAPQAPKSLYERLGGAFAIASVIDHFSDVPLSTARSMIFRSRRAPPWELRERGGESG